MKIADLFFLNSAERKLLFMYQNQNKWRENENFSNSLNHISSIVESINDHRDKLGINRQSDNENLKLNDKRQLAKTATTIAKKAKVYAMHVNDSAMKENFSFTFSEIMKLRDNEVVIKINQILDELTPIINSLTLYGITNEDLDELCSDLSIYLAINSPLDISDSEKGRIKTEINWLTSILRSELKSIEEKFNDFKNPKHISV